MMVFTGLSVCPATIPARRAPRAARNDEPVQQHGDHHAAYRRGERDHRADLPGAVDQAVGLESEFGCAHPIEHDAAEHRRPADEQQVARRGAECGREQGDRLDRVLEQVKNEAGRRLAADEARRLGIDAERARIAQELEVPEGMGVILRTAGASRTKTGPCSRWS